MPFDLSPLSKKPSEKHHQHLLCCWSFQVPLGIIPSSIRIGEVGCHRTAEGWWWWVNNCMLQAGWSTAKQVFWGVGSGSGLLSASSSHSSQYPQPQTPCSKHAAPSWCGRMATFLAGKQIQICRGSPFPLKVVVQTQCCNFIPHSSPLPPTSMNFMFLNILLPINAILVVTEPPSHQPPGISVPVNFSRQIRMIKVQQRNKKCAVLRISHSHLHQWCSPKTTKLTVRTSLIMCQWSSPTTIKLKDGVSHTDKVLSAEQSKTNIAQCHYYCIHYNALSTKQ